MVRPLGCSAGEVAGLLREAGVGHRDPVSVAVTNVGVGLAAAHGVWAVRADPATVVAEVEAELGPRWVWWSARGSASRFVAAGVHLGACWDLAAVHRVLHGGRRDDPGAVWAAAHGLPLPAVVPRAWPAGNRRSGQLDLLSFADDLAALADSNSAGPARSDVPVDSSRFEGAVTRDGQLRPSWAARAAGDRAAAAGDDGTARLSAAAELARLALVVMAAQELALDRVAEPRRHRPRSGRPSLAVLTARAESAAELLACELERDGLPLDRTVAEATIAQLAGGVRPRDGAEHAQARQARDAPVLELLGTDVDLRNPAAVRAALGRLGLDLPDTRAHRLTALREVHPVVPALLAWRKAERIATTYGYRWLDEHVGADGRLRGSWQGSDGAGGRMTAAAGLHNLPAELRVAVAAEPGYRLVRADLGQVEPRVLAVVSGDRALAAATRTDDLYAPVAAMLGEDRPTAKVAVLAAMYGQTSGAAGAALRRMRQVYPTALAYLDTAESAGRAGDDVRTFGGRLVRSGMIAAETDLAVAARGRFARNAVVQGAAAEFFKAWAATVRQALVPLGGAIVLCLHDELLLHVPADRADGAARALHQTLDATAGYWAAGSGVRFVADVSVVDRWADAKS